MVRLRAPPAPLWWSCLSPAVGDVIPGRTDSVVRRQFGFVIGRLRLVSVRPGLLGPHLPVILQVRWLVVLHPLEESALQVCLVGRCSSLHFLLF